MVFIYLLLFLFVFHFLLSLFLLLFFGEFFLNRDSFLKSHTELEENHREGKVVVQVIAFDKVFEFVFREMDTVRPRVKIRRNVFFCNSLLLDDLGGYLKGIDNLPAISLMELLGKSAFTRMALSNNSNIVLLGHLARRKHVLLGVSHEHLLSLFAAEHKNSSSIGTSKFSLSEDQLLLVQPNNIHLLETGPSSGHVIIF